MLLQINDTKQSEGVFLLVNLDLDTAGSRTSSILFQRQMWQK